MSEPHNHVSAGSESALPEWEDPRVQIVYGALCDPDLHPPPNPEEHWEGWLARNIVKRLFSDLPQTSGMWQPIDSAPQDGTRILATGGGLGETVEVVTYNERVGCWSAETCTLDDTDHESQGYNRPTLWQPMPATSAVSRPLLLRDEGDKA